VFGSGRTHRLAQGGNAGFIAVPARYNPTQTSVPSGGGLSGPIAQNYGAPQAGLSPQVDTWFGSHFPISGGQIAEAGGTLRWARPYFPNIGGIERDQAVTTFQPGLNRIAEAGGPATPPTWNWKRYDQATGRLTFGQWSQNFPSGNGEYVSWELIPGQQWRDRYTNTGMPMQLGRQPRLPVQPSSYVRLNFFGAQPQMEGPYYPLLTDTAQTGSYGQWTTVLPSTPVGMESVYG